MVIGNGVEVFYYTVPVESEDQAVSLEQYLTRHGQSAYKNQPDEVIIPLDCPTKESCADQSSLVYQLVECWKLFWEHSDSGVFELPIYQKD